MVYNINKLELHRKSKNCHISQRQSPFQSIASQVSNDTITITPPPFHSPVNEPSVFHALLSTSWPLASCATVEIHGEADPHKPHTQPQNHTRMCTLGHMRTKGSSGMIMHYSICEMYARNHGHAFCSFLFHVLGPPSHLNILKSANGHWCRCSSN